jgi:tRNA pseudouridine38-40 synthase
MPRYKLTLEYAGTRYSGWQIQKNARTVQGELERALGAATRSPRVATCGSGRTDAGVHALGQVAHADLTASLPPGVLRQRVNDALPADINVLAAERTTPRFHARHSAVARSYVYQVARRRTAFAKPYVWWVKDDLDAATLEAAGRLLSGFGDYRHFTEDDPEEKSTRVLVDGIQVQAHGALVLIRVTGSHFLWKMVRRMVGVMVEAARGRVGLDEVGELMRPGGSADRLFPARLTAPASGLFLERVFYEGDHRDLPLVPACLLVN